MSAAHDYSTRMPPAWLNTTIVIALKSIAFPCVKRSGTSPDRY